MNELSTERLVAMVGALSYSRHSVGTWLSALTANLPPAQVLCRASTFSQTDRFQTFYGLFAFFFLCKIICIHQVQLR